MMKDRSHSAPHEGAVDAPEGTSGDVFLGVLRVLVTEAVREALAGMRDELQEAMARGIEPRAAPGVDDKQMLSVEDVARRLNVRPATVREWIRSGFLPAVPLGPAGRRYGVRPEELERLLEKRAAEKNPMDSDALAIQIVRAARVRSRGRKE